MTISPFDAHRRISGNKNTSSIQTLELFAYVVIASVATYYSYEHAIAHRLLESVLARDPTALQQLTLCVGVWLAYLACVLLVFYKSAKLIRRYGCCTLGVCGVVQYFKIRVLMLRFSQYTASCVSM